MYNDNSTFILKRNLKNYLFNIRSVHYCNLTFSFPMQGKALTSGTHFLKKEATSPTMTQGTSPVTVTTNLRKISASWRRWMWEDEIQNNFLVFDHTSKLQSVIGQCPYDFSLGGLLPFLHFLGPCDVRWNKEHNQWARHWVLQQPHWCLAGGGYCANGLYRFLAYMPLCGDIYHHVRRIFKFDSAQMYDYS